MLNYERRSRQRERATGGVGVGERGVSGGGERESGGRESSMGTLRQRKRF